MDEEEQVYDAGDERQVKVKKTKAALQAEREREELEVLLDDKRVRDFIWRVLDECRLFSVIASHQTETFRELGRRDVGLWLMGEIFSAYPPAYTQMRVEHPDEEG